MNNWNAGASGIFSYFSEKHPRFYLLTMTGRLLVFFLCCSAAVFAQEKSSASPGKKNRDSKFFYSIGTEWINFYSYGFTEDGSMNYTGDFLPSCLSMEFRENIIERDSLHSFSVAFAPQTGYSIFTTSDDIVARAALPVFFQYNTGLHATHHNNSATGKSIGIGAAFNCMNGDFITLNAQSFISIDVQLATYRHFSGGKIKYNYLRAGVDPAIGKIPEHNFHVDFGVGRSF